MSAVVPPTRAILVTIPNGEGRSKATAGILKAMGVRAGASDTILILPQGRTVWLEFKRPDDPSGKGRQSLSQKLFEADLKALGHEYAVVASTDEFIALLKRVGAI